MFPLGAKAPRVQLGDSFEAGVSFVVDRGTEEPRDHNRRPGQSRKSQAAEVLCEGAARAEL